MKQFNIKTGGGPVAGSPLSGTSGSRATTQAPTYGTSTYETDKPANAPAFVQGKAGPYFNKTQPGLAQPIGAGEELELNVPSIDNQNTLGPDQVATTKPGRSL